MGATTHRSQQGKRPSPPTCAARMLTAALLALTAAAGVPAAATALEAYPSEQFRHAIGINTHFGHAGIYKNRAEDVKRALIDSGILYIRERANNTVITQARALWNCCRIRTLARIDYRYGNSYDAKLDPSQIPAEVDKALAIGTEALIGFEGPNEYTHHQKTGDWDGDLRDYIARTRDYVRNVKKLSIPIIGPTIYLRSLPDLQQLGNIGNLIEASNLHFYTRSYPPSFRLDEHFTNVQIMAPGEPVWVTEFGYHQAVNASMPVSELTAARYLPRELALFFGKSPRGKFFNYELMDEGTNSSDDEHFRGLVRYDMSRKPAFYTIQRLIDAVEGGSLGLAAKSLDIGFSGQTEGLRTLLLQKTGSQYLLLMWQEVASWDSNKRQVINVPRRSVTVSLPRDAKVDVIDTLPYPSNAKAGAPPLRIANSTRSAQISVPDHVIIVQLDLL